MSKFLLTLCAVFGLLLSSASAQEDAKDEAWRLEGLQKIEFTRYVSSEKKSHSILRTHLARTARLQRAALLRSRLQPSQHMEPSRLFRETVFPVTQRRTYASNATIKKRAVSSLTTNQPEGTSGPIRSTFLSSIRAGWPERCITT
jgi:hypothetical protein